MTMKPSRLLRRSVLGALGAVLLLVAGGLGVNLYLNGQYVPRLVEQELSGLSVRYDFAWSLWPGRLNFEELRVRGEEDGFVWELTADRASLKADVGALLDRRIALERLVLSGTTARVRPRLHYLDATPEYLAVLPVMEGAEPELLREGPVPPPGLQPGATWSISLPRVAIEGLRALHVERYAFSGEVDAEGSLSLTSDRVLTVGETDVRARRGEVRVNGAPVLQRIEGAGRSAMEATALSGVRGPALLSGLRGEAELRAEVVGLPFLPELPGLPVPVELSRGAGPIHTQVSMKGGAVQPGATLSWDVEEAVLETGGFAFTGGFSLRAEVIKEEGEARTRCAMTFGQFQMGRPDAAPLVSGERMALLIDAPNVDLARADRFADTLQRALRRFPATLELERVRLLGEERTLQWEATFDALDTVIDLSAAERRELLIPTATGQGARVRLRPRYQAPEATAQALRHLPPIEGLPHPPLVTPGPAHPLLVRAAQNPWSIKVEDARIDDLREVWLEAYRLQGRAHLKGGFHYEAGGRLSAGPLAVDLAEGELHVAKWRAAKAVRGKLEASARPFDLQETVGYGFFRYVSARSELSAQLDEVDFIRHFPTVPMPAALGGGQGPLQAKLSVRDGVVQGGSEVRWETKAVQASTMGHRFIGPFELEARWADSGGEPRLRLEGRVSPYKVTRQDSEVALVSGRLATLRMDAPKFDLARPVFEPLTQVRVVDGQVPDLRVVNAYLPDDLPLRMEEGAGTFTGLVAFPLRGAAAAELKISGQKAALTYDRIQVRGDWSCEAKLTNVNMLTGAADIQSASVVLDNMAMREGSSANANWFGRFDVTGGTLRPGEPVLVQGDLETTMRDGRPLVAFFASETDLMPPWARSLLTLQALRATSSFRVGQDMVELDRLQARGQSLEIRGRVRKKGQSQWGDMLVQSRGQEVGVAVRGSRVELKLIGAAAWYRGQMLEPRW